MRNRIVAIVIEKRIRSLLLSQSPHYRLFRSHYPKVYRLAYLFPIGISVERPFYAVGPIGTKSMQCSNGRVKRMPYRRTDRAKKYAHTWFYSKMLHTVLMIRTVYPYPS
jgi:hypothetical protein